MSRRILIASAPILCLAAPVHAQDSQSVTETLRLFADAAPACVVSEASLSSAANATFAASGSSGGTITITQLADPETAEPRSSEIALELPVVCNAAHRLIVQSGAGGLLRAGGQASNALRPNGFADFLTYQLNLDWAGSSLSGASNGLTGFVLNEGAATGRMRLRISTEAGGGALTAGRYDDTITIRFEPAS